MISFFIGKAGLDLLVIQHDRSDGMGEFFSLFRQENFSDRDQATLDLVAWPLQSALINARTLPYPSGVGQQR